MAIESQERFTLVGLPAEDRLADFARDVATGLTASPKRLPCRYFYDRLGSRLFEAICELPEYYLPRVETEILQEHASEIAALFHGATDLVELGSGTAAKTRLLIDAFLRRHLKLRYVPLDICQSVLEESSQGLLRTYTRLEILAISGDYYEGLEHLRSLAASRKLVLWLGSNIGNLERTEAASFLARLRTSLAPGDRLLIGIDLRKDRSALEAAYDDPCGVTAAFNRNLLVRANSELGSNFDVRSFEHRAVYNEEVGRVEMYLVSTRPQRVHLDLLGLEVQFGAGEAIHTENSYKYSPTEIESLAADASLRTEQAWLDADSSFRLNLFGVP
jgi:L-histidine N-alpha-methyltransferase